MRWPSRRSACSEVSHIRGCPRVRLIVALSLFGAFIELAQATPLIHRDCDPLDWVADTLACVLVVVAIHRWRAARR